MSGDLNRADCAFVDRWLEDWLAGRLDPDVAGRIDEHVAGCERCRQLKAVVAGSEADANGAPEDGAFLSAVMDQTTGSPCGRAETLLPGLVDEDLDADSREILQAHLAHCSGCSRLLAALQEAQRVLPTLAEFEPPLGFTQRVLGATVGAAPPPWWLRVLARPRASLELAYVGAVLLVVLLGNPVAAFTQAEQRASQLAGAVPVARLSEQLGVRDAATEIVAQVLSMATSVVNAVQTEVATRLNEARALVQAVQTAIANAIAWISNIDISQMLGRDQAPPPRGQPTEPGVRR